MNNEDTKVAEAVRYCLEDVAAAIDLIADRVKKGGRVIYIGAGTSGRYFSRCFLSLLSGKEIDMLTGLGYWMPRKCKETTNVDHNPSSPEALDPRLSPPLILSL